MSPWELPTSLEVGGVGYAIRTDFRDVLHVLDVFASPEYEPDERAAICLRVIYEDWESIPAELQGEALDRAADFIDMDIPGESGGRKKPRTVDWKKDAPVIIPAVNKVLGCEVRGLEHLHWWTFLSAYMEIGDGLFSTVLGIRQKKAKGKRLEKYEREFYKANKALVDMEKRDKARAAEEKAALDELFGIKR